MLQPYALLKFHLYFYQLKLLQNRQYLAGEKPHINYNLIPGIVYTWPEAAAVGKTEDELKEAKIDYKAGKFSMRALGRSRASGDIDGFVKVLADKNTDEILGVHMVGARVADLIIRILKFLKQD